MSSSKLTNLANTTSKYTGQQVIKLILDGAKKVDGDINGIFTDRTVPEFGHFKKETIIDINDLLLSTEILDGGFKRDKKFNYYVRFINGNNDVAFFFKIKKASMGELLENKEGKDSEKQAIVIHKKLQNQNVLSANSLLNYRDFIISKNKDNNVDQKEPLIKIKLNDITFDTGLYVPVAYREEDEKYCGSPNYSYALVSAKNNPLPPRPRLEHAPACKIINKEGKELPYTYGSMVISIPEVNLVRGKRYLISHRKFIISNRKPQVFTLKYEVDGKMKEVKYTTNADEFWYTLISNRLPKKEPSDNTKNKYGFSSYNDGEVQHLGFTINNSNYHFYRGTTLAIPELCMNKQFHKAGKIYAVSTESPEFALACNFVILGVFEGDKLRHFDDSLKNKLSTDGKTPITEGQFVYETIFKTKNSDIVTHRDFDAEKVAISDVQQTSLTDEQQALLKDDNN